MRDRVTHRRGYGRYSYRGQLIRKNNSGLPVFRWVVEGGALAHKVHAASLTGLRRRIDELLGEKEHVHV